MRHKVHLSNRNAVAGGQKLVVKLNSGASTSKLNQVCPLQVTILMHISVMLLLGSILSAAALACYSLQLCCAIMHEEGNSPGGMHARRDLHAVTVSWG